MSDSTWTTSDDWMDPEYQYLDRASLPRPASVAVALCVALVGAPVAVVVGGVVTAWRRLRR